MSSNGTDRNGEETDGRDTGGRFTLGNTAAKGHGRPAGSAMAEARERILEKLAEPGRLERVLEGLLVAAEAGDVAAARVVLERAAGRVGEVEAVLREMPEATAGPLEVVVQYVDVDGSEAQPTSRYTLGNRRP